MKRWVGVVAVALTAACAGSDSGGGGATSASIHCTWTGDICSQVTKGAFSAADVTALQDACTTGGGTYADGGCPTAATVDGFCFNGDFQLTTGTAVANAQLFEYYGTASWDAATAAADCGGIWIGGASPEATAYESETNNFPSTADGPFTADAVVAGSIAPAGSRDYFAVTNTSAAPVIVHLATFTGAVGSCGADTILTLETADGDVLAVDDDTFGACSVIDWEFPAGATLYARVTDYGDNSTIANYLLQIDFP